MPQPIEATNDFVVQFANVNGSGSASANRLFAKSILRMGVPVASRNIFPSNIQGLPTWYEVRVSEAGWRGRRGGVDLMVAMNPQTWDKDVASIEPGGYLFYDSTRPLPPSQLPRRRHGRRRAADRDLQPAPTPTRASASCSRTSSTSARWPALLGIDAGRAREADRPAVQGQGPADRRPTSRPCTWAGTTPPSIWPAAAASRSARADRVGDRIFVDGNDAAALGCVYGGATVGGLVPDHALDLAGRGLRPLLPPATAPIRETGKSRYAIVQAEDELAAIGMVIGAAWNGARAFTATSGPGISLMQEFIGLAYFAEVPAVIFDVQRGGPSTGMPTRTQQSDILACAYASHGDTKHVLLFPEDPSECFEFAAAGLRPRRPAADAGLRPRSTSTSA